MQNVFRSNAGVSQINAFHLFRQQGLQHAAKHRFAAADFAHYLDDAFTAIDGIDQRVENGAAVAARKKEFSIGGALERRLPQSEMCSTEERRVGKECVRTCKFRGMT